MLTRAMELHQRTGNISFASLSLNLFADLYLSMGNLDLAYRFASEAYQQADLSGNRFDQAYANIRKGIVVLRGGGDDAGFSDSRDRNAFAVELLTRALELGKEIGSIELIAISTLYLAEAQIGLSVVKGRDLLKSARDLVTTYGDVCLVGELKRIEARYQGERMVVTGENCLSISGNFLPRIPAAKAELERFLIKNALEQAGQNQSEAGRLLGVSKAYIHQKRKQYGI
ncbi:MAG: hypothetical protein HY650_08770 [Acidobacteria bacterium]|nr:hypothetical protein [Acidobacteriota bacterium]